ncbi:hypothetical protein EPN81_03895 [Patescibacteria group bacterium]|nr:MAG: hypothetical protein EPN81_03895 [Patescibacteria group bacterium]
MILLHRISSFGVACVAVAGFLLLVFPPFHPYLIIFCTVFFSFLILGRLLAWQIRTFQFWHLLGTPLLLLLSSFGPFFLLERTMSKLALSVLVVALLFLFVEHVFSFIHLPVAYQPFTLEYLSGLLHILSVFFLSVLGFGLSLFLQTPLWLLSLIFFFILFFIVYGTLWVGKVDSQYAKPYAFAGAVLTTELFASLSFLPTGFYTNAAFLALGVYVFLGLSRAHAMHKLSKEVLRRYLIVFVALTTLIILTSQWV